MIGKSIAAKFPANFHRQCYIRSKIASDPAYDAVFSALKDLPGPLWDGGCGLGLLAFYLIEKGWTGNILGTDTSVEKIGAAQCVAQKYYSGVAFQIGSIANPPPDFQGNVVLLDVMHYLSPEAQKNLLAQVIQMVPPGGVCLIRYTAKDRSWRYALTVLEELMIRCIGWIRGGHMCFPTCEEMAIPFQQAGWQTSTKSLWGKTPFNSYLLTAIRPGE